MTFNKLQAEELANVAEFFAVEVVAGDPEKGPSKKELLAALAAGEKPVTWDDYETIYVPTVVAPVEETAVTPEPAVVAVVVEPPVVEEPVILKMERENPRFDIYGYSFTKQHPFRPVTEDAADYIMANEEGFRPATPREVKEYYDK